MSDTNKYVSKKELWTFGIAALGQGTVYTVMSSYVSDFYINVMQLPLVFVMLLMLLARVWDAINDSLMGFVADRATSPFGKLRPYVLFAAAPIATLTVLMYFAPEIGRTGSMLYAGAVYVLWGMAYTVADVPFWSLPNVMTPLPDERANVIAFGRTLNGVGSVFPILLFSGLGFVLPYLTEKTGVELDKTKYLILAAVCTAVGMALYVNSYFHIKERVLPPRKKSDGQVLKRILSCKPLMLVVLMGVLASGRYMTQAASVHVARYAFYVGPDLALVDNPTAAIQSSITIVNVILTACSALGMFGSMLLMPLLYKKYDYKKIVLFSCLAGFIASLMTTLLGGLSIYYNMGSLFFATIPFVVLQCVPLGVLNTTSYAMVGDCLDYMEWKTGYRDNALGSACQSFVNKLGNALATTLIIVVYLLIDLNPADMYASSAVVVATDLPFLQRFAMFSTVSLIQGVSLLLCTIPIFFYDLTGEKKATVTKELALRRAQDDIKKN
ncbi:MAG: MFS transporter [Clostridia bacterium]|nr:MFS transporter [Clostridia bacterium]